MFYKKKKKTKWFIFVPIIIILFLLIGIGILAISGKNINSYFGNIFKNNNKEQQKPEDVLFQYFSYINDGKYEEMYSFLDDKSKAIVSQEEFITKNKNIYEGIEAKDLKINITDASSLEKGEITINYITSMDTLAGNISFSNKAILSQNEEKQFKLFWATNSIFPSLDSEDKVKVNTLPSERGSIYDRNGSMLAGSGTISSIGLVPGKMSENKDEDIAKISELLDVPIDNINKMLNEPYVNSDTFVPIKMISKGQDELENKLLLIKGIMITDVNKRYYPLGEKASHLTGYVQNVSQEDLDNLKDKGYNENSVIGKSGLEQIYEDTLRSIDGYEILIVDSLGYKKETLAEKEKKDGTSITLTIDKNIQSLLYDEFKSDKNCSVAMDPKTGEVLALISTPSFNANDFVLGISEDKWNALNDDLNKPMYNRFMAALCPGSSFKPIIAGIGVSSRKINPDENYGYAGLSWQKDPSWGNYKITTTKEYGNIVNLRNALIYSDNIYFAKAALNIGGDLLKDELFKLGFDEKIPFEYNLYSSIFSNDSNFDSEIQLADSGYGQGQVLINPVHMASLYSAFLNDGNMIKPYLIKKDGKTPEYFIENGFTKEASDILYDDLKAVADHTFNSLGLKNDLGLAGKTGTAEIKKSQDDALGTEFGWFNAFTYDKNSQNPMLIITMVEDVKNRGGSGYVVPKVKNVLDNMNLVKNQ